MIGQMTFQASMQLVGNKNRSITEQGFTFCSGKDRDLVVQKKNSHLNRSKAGEISVNFE